MKIRERQMPQDQALENNQEEEQQEQTEEQGKLAEVVKSNIKIILSAGLIFVIIVLLVMSNLLTGYLTFLVTRKVIQKTLIESKSDIELNDLLGPLYIFGSTDYMVEFQDEPIYLRIDLNFELENLFMLDEVREKAPRIQNIVREIITNTSVDEFKSRAGMQTARRLMLESINRILTKGKIKDIYFLDYRFLKSEYIEQELSNKREQVTKGAEDGE